LGVVKSELKARNDSLSTLVVGNNSGLLSRCWVSGKIEVLGGVHVGGLTAFNDGTISNSYSAVKISVSGTMMNIGGLAGYSHTNGLIESSYAVNAIAVRKASSLNLGGMIGENFGSVGDIFAENTLTEGRQLTATNVGGVVGKNHAGAAIAAAYAAGPIVNKHGSPFGGGLIGFDAAKPGSIADSYWDLDMGIADPHQGAGNLEDDPGITGLTTGQFQQGLPPGFDPKIWGSNAKVNQGFPYLRAVPIK
jgi:hypothetical protein